MVVGIASKTRESSVVTLAAVTPTFATSTTSPFALAKTSNPSKGIDAEAVVPVPD